ncbi:hypothetical protein C8R42DRAFT_637096 [Lentinula raphanica]|nr:hypothetical protein C8R42DRAFT_637096 [Lentinula raphanica]
MTFRGTGSNNTPPSQPFSGTFAHTGLNFGAGSQNNRIPNSNQPDSGPVGQASANAAAAAPSAGVNPVAGVNARPQPMQVSNSLNQGNASEQVSQSGSNNIMESQDQAGEQARRAAEDELRTLQRRMAEIQGLLATTPSNPDKLFVEPSSSDDGDSQDLPQSFSPSKKALRVPSLPDIIDGFTASTHTLRLKTQSVPLQGKALTLLQSESIRDRRWIS